jgi:hypothetical protein
VLIIHSNPRARLKVNIIGEIAHFSLYSLQKGFVLTRPETLTYPQMPPLITLQTTSDPITITPAKTALFIIDRQNFFLSRTLGHNGEEHSAEAALFKHATPVARKTQPI